MYEKDIGKKIKELRKIQGVSQEELAAVLDKSGNSSVSKIENGTQAINADELRKIAIKLKVTPNEILGFRSIKESTILNNSVINKQLKLREFKSETTRFEWLSFFVIVIAPILIIFMSVETSYLFLFILAIVVFVVFFNFFVNYLKSRRKNSIKVQTDVNNSIIYTNKWQESQLIENRKLVIFISFIGAGVSFLYILAFSSSLEIVTEGKSWIAVLITLILYIPPMVRISCSLNLNDNIDVDYKEIKDNSILFYVSLFINIVGLFFVAFYITYQKSINLDLFKSDLLFVSVVECVITLFILFAHTAYLENYEVFLIENKSNRKTKVEIHSKLE